MNSESQKAPRKRGRPPKGTSERKNTYLGFRVRDGMREKLEASAEARSMSVSEEIERRLDLSLDMALDPFKSIALRMIVEKWKIIDALVGEGCSIEDPSIYSRAAHNAVEEALGLASDPGWVKGQSVDRIRDYYGRLIEKGITKDIAARHGHNLQAASTDAEDRAFQHEMYEDAIGDLPLVKAEQKAQAPDPTRRKANV